MAPRPIFYHLAFVSALAPGIIGLNAIFNPSKGLEMLGFPFFAKTPSNDVKTTPSRQQQQQQTQPSSEAVSTVTTTTMNAAECVMQMYGSRNVALTLSSLAVWATAGDTRTLVWVLLAGVPLAVVDGFVSRARVGPGSEWGHWMFAPVGPLIAGGLLEWY